MQFLTDPWAWWIQPFTDSSTMQRALLAGLLAVLATSVIGTWVVLRGMTFLGDALAHGVLPGIALAYLLGGNAMLGALFAALVMVVGINVVRSHSPLPDDVSIGLLFVAMLSLSVVIVSSATSLGEDDLNRLLFGSVAEVDPGDHWRQALAVLVTLAGAVAFHRAFLVLTFDEA